MSEETRARAPLRDRLEAWASENTRLLLILCGILGIPWIVGCYALTFSVAIALTRGTCGG
jgi:hypothetical protein